MSFLKVEYKPDYNGTASLKCLEKKVFNLEF